MESKGKGIKGIKSNIKVTDSYYKKELGKLKGNGIYINSLCIIDGGGSSTRWLGLNVECIDEVIYYLQGLREELVKGSG